MEGSVKTVMDYILYCDESEIEGRYFSNFYGGALISGKHFDMVNAALNKKKLELNIKGEVKWSKVTENYLTKYMELMDTFFCYIKQNIVKVRVMFTQNCRVPVNLTRQQHEDTFFKLYYQFFKHIFGLQYCNDSNDEVFLKPYFDTLPDKKEKCNLFKEYVLRLQDSEQFKSAKITIRREDIAEVKSHDHVILQCMDVILGSMFFRLNNFHLEKPEGNWKRGKRTIAKEKLYKHILRHIRELYPEFNIGVTTGVAGNNANRWLHPYRHWLFEPKEYEFDYSKAKKNSKKYLSPIAPT